jgi:PAS domain S-box-containing protein
MPRQTTQPPEDFYSEQFRFLIDVLSDYAIFALDLKNRIRTWNPGVQRLVGYREKEFLAHNGSVIFTPEDRRKKEDLKELRIARTKGRAINERWHLRKDGTRFWGSGIMAGLRDPKGKLHGFVKIMRDETARREAEDKLQRSNEMLEERVKERTRDLLTRQEQLRMLARELSRAEQNVRQRIAAELHDDVAQLLAICSYPIAAVRVALNDPEARKQIDAARKCLDQAIDNVRRMMTGLSPVAMDERSLRSVIDWAIDTVREHGVHVRVDDDGREKPMSRELLVLLGNIVRELLVNVAKHAKTSVAHVSIRREANNAVVTVRDQGKGFKANAAGVFSRRGGFGLYSIRARLQLMDGTMELRSQPGKGTKVVLTAPLDVSRRAKRSPTKKRSRK